MTTSHPSASTSRHSLLAAGPATTTVGLIADASVAAPAGHVADRLGLGLAVFNPATDDGGDLAAMLAFAAACDAVSVDPAVVGVDRLPPEHLDALRDAGHRVWPDPVVVRLSQDRALARHALGTAGFPVVTADGAPAGGAPAGANLSVVVARRPSGWWRARVAAPAGRGPVLRAPTLADARALAASVADGLVATGSLAVDLVLGPSGDLAVAGVTAGPRPPAALGGAALEDHLRALLDRPFAATPHPGPGQQVPAVAARS